MKRQTTIIIMRIIEVLTEATKHRGQQGGGRKPYRGSQQRGRGQQNNYRGQYQGNCGQCNTSSRGYYNNNYYSNC